MTNIASGQKRSWEEAEIEANKRASRDGRDWRDVHLKSPPRKPSGRGHGHERRIPGYHDGNGRRGGQPSSRSSNGDSSRRGDSCEKHNKDVRSKGDSHRSRSPQQRGNSRSNAPRIEDEKEEGE
jgi:hypothetical protein